MRLLGLVAVMLAASHVTAGQGARSACGPATARAAIASTHVRMKLFGKDLVRIDPKAADKVICSDFTRDGRVDLAVTIASGGTAGDVGFVVFQGVEGRWRVALTRLGYKLGLFRVGDDLVFSQPVYRKNDPNCCPTGGFDHLRFHWQGARFAVVQTWHTKSYRP